MSFKAWLEAKNIRDIEEYNKGWDETAYGLKNWTKKDEAPEEWARRLIAKIEKLPLDPRLAGSLAALKKFLQDGSIEYIGTSTGYYDDPGSKRPSPFSSN
jgi:hypothetical protein